MANSAITSLALVTVNWEDRKKGYVEYFAPFLAESIRRMNSEVMGAYEVQDAVQTEFGLHLPIYTITRLLRLLERQGYIRLETQAASKLQNGDKQQRLDIYNPNLDKLKDLPFQKIQQDVLRQHEELIKSFISFCEEKGFNKPLSAQEAEDALLSFLTESGGLHMISMTARAIVTVPYLVK